MYFTVLLSGFFCSLVACEEKDGPGTDNESKATIYCSTGDVDEVTINSATMKGTAFISDASSMNGTACFYVSTVGTDASSVIAIGTRIDAGNIPAEGGSFSAVASNLEPATTYYYVARATIDNKEATGAIASFTTLSRPKEVIVTAEAADITEWSVRLYGYADLEQAGEGAQFGIILSTDENPSTSNGRQYRSIEIDRNNKYFVEVTGLNSKSTFYYKAYVKSGDLLRVGEVKSFTTEPINASVKTIEATTVLNSKATIEGSLTYTTSKEFEKGVGFYCSYTANDLESLIKTGFYISTEIGENNKYNSVLEFLGYSTKYYYVAHAKVYDTDFYGEIKSFTTKELEGGIDMGLPSGLKWAPSNIGTKFPTENGDYYAWGETETKEFYNWQTYKWANGTQNSLTKYNFSDSYGVVDNKYKLEDSDDVAHIKLGGSWRMPEYSDYQELFDNCEWIWSYVNGKYGYKVVSKKNGNSVFFPAAGYMSNSIQNEGSHGYYTVSNLYDYYYPYNSYGITFYSKNHSIERESRQDGHTIRAVMK